MRAHEDDAGEPVTRIEPRALMVPPGIPDFLTRRRFLEPGPIALEGRAWSGWGPIERVEVSTDGGATWRARELGDPPGPAAWAPWRFDWDADAGRARAVLPRADATGRSQPASRRGTSAATPTTRSSASRSPSARERLHRPAHARSTPGPCRPLAPGGAQHRLRYAQP